MSARLGVLLALIGCAPAPPPAERVSASPRGAAAGAPERDVVVDGVSVVGRWRAVEVADDPQATRDLRDGTLEIVLVVNPTGHAILRGADRRDGGGTPAAYSGRLDGDRLALRGLPGAAHVAVWGRHLVLDDPRGRRTVFVRLGGGRPASGAPRRR